MYNITLIGTQHEEKGRCSISELYRIIQTIRPEVIFEEIPPSVFDDRWSDPRNHNLEMKAIAHFLKNHQVELVPVDYDAIPDTFATGMEPLMKNVFFDKDNEYRKLLEAHASHVAYYGFRYLNSHECGEQIKKQYAALEIGLGKIMDKELLQAYDLWLDINQKRDWAMIENIYSYSEKHPYERGLFLVGTAHRSSIFDKIATYASTRDVKLNWNYDSYENILY